MGLVSKPSQTPPVDIVSDPQAMAAIEPFVYNSIYAPLQQMNQDAEKKLTEKSEDDVD